MLRLAALGVLGYLGYKYLGKNQAEKSFRRASVVAGGPLSEQASLQSNPDQPPIADPIGVAPA